MDWESLRQEFPVTRNYNFQNHAAVGPLCRRAVEAAREYLESYCDYSYLGDDFYLKVERVRRMAATLVNANSDEICFVKNTSDGLGLVANGLNWKKDDNVVTTNVEFPANMYPWQMLSSQGVSVRMVMEENGRIPLDSLMAAIDSHTRLVTISSIQYASGFRTDLAALGEYCQSRGVFLCVDAIQSLGAFPIDVKEMKIDFLSADGHKWMCAPEGCGIFYVNKETQGYLRPSNVGWLSMKNAFEFDHYQLEFQDSAKRYDNGAYNLVGILALGGALDLLLEVGLDNISNRLLHLTGILAKGVQDKGYQVVSSREPSEASGILAFTSDLHDPQKIREHLQNEHRVAVAVRAGRLRASPHFYNSEKEIMQLVDLLPGH